MKFVFPVQPKQVDDNGNVFDLKHFSDKANLMEIRLRVNFLDALDREHTCEVSSTSVGSQIELARLMGEAFRVLSHHLVAPPNDNLILQTFVLAALDSELEFRE